MLTYKQFIENLKFNESVNTSSEELDSLYVRHKFSKIDLAKIANEFGFENGDLKYLNSGSFGMAFAIEDKVIKLTTDKSEAMMALKLKKMLNHPHIVSYYDVKEIKTLKLGDDRIWGILMDKLTELDRETRIVIYELRQKAALPIINAILEHQGFKTSSSSNINQYQNMIFLSQLLSKYPTWWHIPPDLYNIPIIDSSPLRIKAFKLAAKKEIQYISNHKNILDKLVTLLITCKKIGVFNTELKYCPDLHGGNIGRNSDGDWFFFDIGNLSNDSQNSLKLKEPKKSIQLESVEAYPIKWTSEINITIDLSKEDLEFIANEMGFEHGEMKLIGNGCFGLAYSIGDKIIKITTDDAEAKTATKLQKIDNHPYLISYYDVRQIRIKNKNLKIWVILMDKVELLSDKERDVIDSLKLMGKYGTAMKEFVEYGIINKPLLVTNVKQVYFLLYKLGERILKKQPIPETFQKYADYIVKIYRIFKTCIKLGIIKVDNNKFTQSIDFHDDNIGKNENGDWILFDIGTVDKYSDKLPLKKIVLNRKDNFFDKVIKFLKF